MPRKTNGPIEDAPPAGRFSRRGLLKRALVVLGAGVLIQPYGGGAGVSVAKEPPKKPHCMQGLVLSPGPPWECRKEIITMKCKQGQVRNRNGKCVSPPNVAPAK